jgi:hypothetical protein
MFCVSHANFGSREGAQSLLSSSTGGAISNPVLCIDDVTPSPQKGQKKTSSYFFYGFF